ARSLRLRHSVPIEAPMMGSRSLRKEVVLRLLAVGIVLSLFPAIFIGDVSWFWRHGLHLGLHHLPYRDFVWEFPPLTAPVLAIVRLTRGYYGLFFVAFVALTVTCELGALHLLRRAAPDDDRLALTR